MTRSCSSNAKKGPKRDYNAFKDFHISESEGHILAAWMKFAGMTSLKGLILILSANVLRKRLIQYLVTQKTSLSTYCITLSL